MNIQIDIFIPLWAMPLLGLFLFAWLYLSVWRDYLAIFHLKKVDEAGQLPPFARWLGTWVLLPIGVFKDWLLNLALTIVFLDPPHSLWELVTGRLQRYVWTPAPELAADAPSWQVLLWDARMGWWHVHAWWWQLMPWRRDLALWLDREQLDFADKDHIKKGPSHAR